MSYIIIIIILLKGVLMTTIELLSILETRYPNILPNKEISSYDLGKLIGIQIIIDYIKAIDNKELNKRIKK